MTKAVMFYKIEDITGASAGILAVEGDSGWLFEDAKLIHDSMTDAQIGAFVRNALEENEGDTA